MFFTRIHRFIAGLCLGTLMVALAGGMALAAENQAKPKVRAITAFIVIDRSQYESQFLDALKMLRAAKGTFEKEGYEVQSLRIVTQPFPQYTRGLGAKETLDFIRALDELAAKEDFALNIGPAMMHDSDDPVRMEMLAEILSTLPHTLSSAIIADESGIHWTTIRASARLLKHVAEHSPRSQGNFNFAVTAMLASYTPFYPGAYHTGAGRAFAIGTEGANVVEEVFRSSRGDPAAAREGLKKVLGEHGRALEKIARGVEQGSGWTYMGVDMTPAPLGKVSIGAAIEAFTGAPFGSSGTMTAAAIITEAVHSFPVKRVGYSGLMVPVLEDTVLAQRWTEGKYGIDSLLSYSAVCGTGLDTVPLPGDVTEDQLARILGDVASLAFKWRKPLSARLLPVHGKKAGERTDFDDPFLQNAVIQPLP